MICSRGSVSDNPEKYKLVQVSDSIETCYYNRQLKSWFGLDENINENKNKMLDLA